MALRASRLQPHDPLAVTRQQLVKLLDEGHNWETAAAELGISPGLAFLLRTGLPADGSGVPSLAGRVEEPLALSNPQSLIGTPAYNPTRKPHIVEWVKQRAQRELSAGGDQDG
ncbi:MAG TPA: hypothetical protein VME01_07995 [Solirubrobacteraceae bacterium]|nr:hypothetical protein [Solirubrobacteraceae bacterium]